jgi:hypothetical protein
MNHLFRSVYFCYLNHDRFDSFHSVFERNVTIHPDLGLEHQVLLDRQSSNEQVILEEDW